MTEPTIAESESQSTQRVVDMIVRIGAIATLGLACGLILAPFFVPVVWGAILAITVRPAHDRLTRALGGRIRVSALLLTLSALAVVMVPTVLLGMSAVESGLAFAADVRDEAVVIPAPPAELETMPLIGEPLYEMWMNVKDNAREAFVEWQGELKEIGAWLFGAAGTLALQVLYFALSIMIAGAFLAYTAPGHELMQAIGRRLSPGHGPRLVDLATQTTRSVAKGVVGVASIQALLAGIGMLIAGVPGAGIWALGVLFVAIVQLPPLLVLLPVIVWYFTAASTMAASILAVWLVAVSLCDTALKPMLMGRGLSVPMPVVLLGAIGGMLVAGIIGLFAGAVVLALGHTLFLEWLGVSPEGPDPAEG